REGERLTQDEAHHPGWRAARLGHPRPHPARTRAGARVDPRLDGDDGVDALEDEVAVLRADADRVAVAEVALEQTQRKPVLEQTLDRALQRTGAVRRVPPCGAER